MNAASAIALIVEGQLPDGWSETMGVAVNTTLWPHSISYHPRCPSCGSYHAAYPSMQEAQANKTCPGCSVATINKIKDEVQKVLHDPAHKPKPMVKLVGEAAKDLLPDFDPIEDVERLILNNWVDVALRDFAEAENVEFLDIFVNPSEGDYDDTKPNDATHVKLEVGRLNYWLFKDDDAAIEYTEGVVEQQLRDEPELFNQDWLTGFIDEERLRSAIGDPYEDWEDDVPEDYDELLEFLADHNYVDYSDSDFYDENGDPLPESPERARLLSSRRDDYISAEKPKVDPWEWLRDVYGKDAPKEAIRVAGIDEEKAAAEAVRVDGWSHFLNHWDGSSHELENGAVYCRCN